MKTVATSLLLAIAAIGANAASAAPLGNNEIGSPVVSSVQADGNQVARAQVVIELQSAKVAPNEIGQFATLGQAGAASTVQAQKNLGNSHESVGLNSVYFGA